MVNPGKRQIIDEASILDSFQTKKTTVNQLHLFAQHSILHRYGTKPILELYKAKRKLLPPTILNVGAVPWIAKCYGSAFGAVRIPSNDRKSVFGRKVLPGIGHGRIRPATTTFPLLT